MNCRQNPGIHLIHLMDHPITVPCPHGNDLLAAARTMGAGNGSGVVVQTKRGRPLSGAQLRSLSLPRRMAVAPSKPSKMRRTRRSWHLPLGDLIWRVKFDPYFYRPGAYFSKIRTRMQGGNNIYGCTWILVHRLRKMN